MKVQLLVAPACVAIIIFASYVATAQQGPVVGDGGPNGAGVSGSAGNVGVFGHNTTSNYDAYLATSCCAGDFNGPVAVHGRLSVREIEVGGADLAEPFEMSNEAEIPPGMVVSINPSREGALQLSGEAYDRAVVGVVSGANGLHAGVILKDPASVQPTQPVALSGRVYCWADTTSGPINPGDLLTTSGIRGHAMRVTDYQRAQGAVLGKAMSALQEGNGLVLVLVTLQ